MNIAFLGLGAMGTRMAKRLLEAGYPVTVWNRSLSAANSLQAAGATVAVSPAAAASKADIVISMVRDDAASQQTWLGDEGALATMNADSIGIECSTLSLPYLQRLAHHFEQQGRQLVDAPVAGSRPQAEAGQLIFFAGGQPRNIETVKPVLLAIGASVHHSGPVSSGMTVKLMVNALLGTQLAAIAELISFAKKSGGDAAAAMEMIGQTSVASPALMLASSAMLAGQHEPMFPIDLVAKDFSLLAQSADSVAAATPVSASVRSIFEAAGKAGLSQRNITAVSQRYW